MMCESPRLAIPCQSGATLVLDMYAPAGMIHMAEERTAPAGLRPHKVDPDEPAGLHSGKTLSQEGSIADALHAPEPHRILALCTERGDADRHSTDKARRHLGANFFAAGKRAMSPRP